MTDNNKTIQEAVAEERCPLPRTYKTICERLGNFRVKIYAR
jgi:hypothetical protein